MPRFAVLVTWHEITGSEPTASDLQERLTRYGLSSVLTGLARITALLQTWRNEGNPAVDRALARQYLPNYFARINALYATGDDRVVFPRLSLLFVANEACRLCGANGEEVRSPEDVERILSCCLIANDLLLKRRPTDTDTAIDKAANLLPFADYVPQDSYPNELARGLLLFEEISPTVEHRNFVDFTSAFRDATGLAPRLFCELVFSASIKFITHVDSQLQDPATSLTLTVEYFQHTTIPRDRIVEFLQQFAISVERLHTIAVQQAGLGSDFLIFQRYPLIEFQTGSFLCIDPGFLLDKAGRSLYWTLHDRQPRNRQLELLAYWSETIERYVQYLFRETYKARGRIFYSPRFSNGDEAFDICLFEASCLLVFEIKASILTVQAKYGFDAAKLKQELDVKAIKGQDGGRKGVAQLYAGITRFLGGDEIPGLSRNEVKTIYPILIFLDNAFAAPYLNKVYNEHFDRQEIRQRYRLRVTPLFSLTVEDFENVLPHTDRHWLGDILDSYWRENPGMYGRLSHSSVPLLLGEPPGWDVVRNRFKTFGDDLRRRLFPTDQAAV